jgi:hypothetical protein
VVKITTSNGPTHHCPHILKHSTCRYWGILDLAVDHSGNVSTMQFIQWDVTNDRQHISTQSPFNLRP